MKKTFIIILLSAVLVIGALATTGNMYLVTQEITTLAATIGV